MFFFSFCFVCIYYHLILLLLFLSTCRFNSFVDRQKQKQKNTQQICCFIFFIIYFFYPCNSLCPLISIRQASAIALVIVFPEKANANYFDKWTVFYTYHGGYMILQSSRIGAFVSVPMPFHSLSISVTCQFRPFL